ncbi:bis(5'-nucleosyl)-tetraphosphatase (symmetrical) YqeK [Phormidium tenue FACHB-886]|nr:bis(5'-nucleosyl)-tetraphosphatase (symmetrical) YqeK [Phormidium tenue FACHB-886]
MRQQVLDWLSDHVPAHRLEHILRVEQMSVDLARQHGIDEGRAAQAALMHDLAKYFKSEKLLEMAQQEGLPLDPVDLANPHLLHADVGAIVARDEFGVEDQEILEAIAHHTLGAPGMSSLSCIIFLADTLELGRGDTLELNELRDLSYEDLELAVWRTCDYTLTYLLERHFLIHPRALLTRNWFMQKAIA